MLICEYVSPLINGSNKILNASPRCGFREPSHRLGQGLLRVAREGRHLAVIKIIPPWPAKACVALTKGQWL